MDWNEGVRCVYFWRRCLRGVVSLNLVSWVEFRPPLPRDWKPRAKPSASHSWPKDSLHYTPRASLVIRHKAKMSPIIYTYDSFISMVVYISIKIKHFKPYITLHYINLWTSETFWWGRQSGYCSGHWAWSDTTPRKVNDNMLHYNY